MTKVGRALGVNYNSAKVMMEMLTWRTLDRRQSGRLHPDQQLHCRQADCILLIHLWHIGAILVK